MGRSPPQPRPPPKALADRDPWPLDAPLVRLGSHDMLTIRDVLAGGVHVLGTTGSGKSSGPMRTLIRGMAAQGWGLLFLCSKRDEADAYFNYAKEAGREKHVIRITPDGDFKYNWLGAELARSGGSIESIVHLLTGVLLEIVRGKQTDSNSDHSYWEDAAKVLLRNALSILAVAEDTIRLDDISRLIVSAPLSIAQVQDESGWQQTSYCARMLAKADKEVTDPMMAHEVKIAVRYFLEEFGSLSDRTRSSILSTLTTSIDVMMHGVLYRLFGTGESSFSLDMIGKGAILIIDINSVEHGETSRIANQLLKYLTQRTLLRRSEADLRPTCIICDEAQNHILGQDWEYAAMGRSLRACSLYATQSLNNYYAKLGPGKEASVQALLAQFQTFVACRSNDSYTNSWLADVISRRWSSKTGSSSQHSMTGATHGSNTNLSLEHPVLPADFLNLRSGGPSNNYCVDTIMIGARPWANGEVYLPVTFSQK